MFRDPTRVVNNPCVVSPFPPSQDVETLSSSAFINFPPTVSNPTRKRKYAEISKHVDVHRPFTIQAPSSSPQEESLRLAPQLLIPRSCLPLAFLDPVGATGDLRGNRWFCARIPALEEDFPSDRRSISPAILIATSEDSPCLYAVERVKCGTYALCRLGAWITLKELEKLNLECRSEPKVTSTQRASSSGNEWWRSSAISADLNYKRGQSQKHNQARLENFRLCLKSPLPNIIAASPIVEEVPVKATEHEAATTLNDTSNEQPPEPLPKDPDEILKMIRTQYQEALYMSQGSLAYFAKGPLSRARAFFNSSDVLSTDGLSLPDYLRTCILSLPIMDKKYRETIPSMVKELPVGVFSEDENDAIFTSLRKKPRKSKTLKPGKDGLYPGEEENVIRWWLDRSSRTEDEDSPGNREESVRIRILEQRARETQLQIILVLETLALEALKPDNNGESVPAVIEEKHFPSKQKPKTKKVQDLNILLHLLVDRLCIWQSMSVEEGGSSMYEGISGSQGMSEQVPSFDVLRNFCVFVVLPFYSARLPDISTALCHKLGGPKPPSPARPRLRKAATSSQVISKPGAAARRQQMRQPRPTLERVLREERSASRNPPSLSRSATDSVLPHLKREVSEVSMSSISISNASISKSRRYSQREVDLGSTSHAKEARLKKKACVEQELKGAIAALKRPNPRIAVKELVEAAEKRAAAANWRKPKNPLRNPSIQGVQVMATPRGKKGRDVFGGLSSLPYPYMEAPPETEEVHEIASTPMTRGKRPEACHLNVLPTIEQTPCRGPSKIIRPLSLKLQNESGPPPVAVLREEYPFKLTTTLISDTGNHGTPSKASPCIQGWGSSKQGIQDTPVKGLKAAQVAALGTSTSSFVGNENDECIYKSLGWDDDADELM